MTSAAGRNTLVDDAADKIRQMIFDGEIKPGEMLPSRKELAEQLDVGISTIHEAIKSLHSVGLVESRPGKGTWVRKDAMESVIHPSFITNRFGALDVDTIYEARLMKEGVSSEGNIYPDQAACLVVKAAHRETQIKDSRFPIT